MNDGEQLWDLLGKSPRREAPAFFATRVMRRISEGEKKSGEGFAAWLQVCLRWFAPTAIAALLLIGFVPFVPVADSSYEGYVDGDLTTLDLVELLSPEDYQILASVDWNY